MPGNCTFNDLWLRNPKFSKWLQKTTDRNKAKCVLCSSVFDISNMGVSALTSHMGGKKHVALASEKPKLGIQVYLGGKQPSQDGQSTSLAVVKPDIQNSQDQQVGLISSFITGQDTLKAEILWALKVCSNHFSYKSCEDIGPLFRQMFPDSSVAKGFSLGETKCAYMCCFGIAPYFRSLLMEKIRKEDSYVLLFDESVNRKLHQKQLDYHIRYWDTDKVVSCYMHSSFLGHATAKDMFSSYEKLSSEIFLPSMPLLQLSMDGPNVNWKFYDMVCDQLKKDTNKTVIQTGSCGLHILHGAFKYGSVSSTWDVERILSSMYYLFKDSPARREDYVNVTSSTLFPLKFCAVRWIENSIVAARAIEMWPHMLKYVKSVTDKNVPNPNTKSFMAIKEAAADPLTPVKLLVFQSIAKEVEPFLIAYQTDKPVLPFLGKDMLKLLRSLMERFIKDDIMKNANSCGKLVRVEVAKKENHLPATKVYLGFAAENRVKDLVHKNVSKDRDIIQLRMECRDFLLEIVKKLLNKCPLQYSVVRNLSCLDPREMNDQKICTTRFSLVLKILVDAGRVEETDCDALLSAYKDFILEFGSSSQFRNFKPEADRLDSLLFGSANSSSNYVGLWCVMKMLLILSHGQASVERGFSVNRQIEVENMHDRTVISQRIICQHVTSVGGVSNVNITNDLIASAASARQKWQSFLEEKRRKKETEQQKLKRKNITDEIDELKTKKQRIEADICELTKSADRFSEQAEATGSLTMVSKSNSLRRTAKEKSASLAEVNRQLCEKLEEYKNH